MIASYSDQISLLSIQNQNIYKGVFKEYLQKMSQQRDQLMVQVVERNFQVNMEDDEQYNEGQIKQPSNNATDIQSKEIGENQFIQNSDSEEEQDFSQNVKQPKSKQQSQEQQSDQEPDYKMASNLIPKQNQKQRLVQQNIKLKAQIFELAKQLDQIIEKDRSKKKKFGLNVIEQDDEIIRDKKLQLKKQQIEIMDVKNKIFVTKRQLDSVYNNLTVTEKQNNNKNLQGYLKTLQKQRQGLLNMNSQQTKALKLAQNQQQYGSKIDQTRQKYLKLKNQTRQMVKDIQQQEKKLKKTHQIYIRKLENLKDVQNKLMLNKQKSKARKTIQKPMITEEMLKTLEDQVKEAEIQKKEGQKNWQQKIKIIDIQLYKKKIQEQKKMLILRQKQRQLKLNELRIRQLKKCVRDNQTAQKQKKSKQTDMSQYRHRRNICYLDK